MPAIIPEDGQTAVLRKPPTEFWAILIVFIFSIARSLAPLKFYLGLTVYSVTKWETITVAVNPWDPA